MNHPTSTRLCRALLVGAPLTLLLWLTLGVGPTVQTYLAKLVGSGQGSIYETAYREGSYKLPPLGDFFGQSLFWPYAIVALAATTAGLTQKRFSATVIVAAGTCFAGLFLCDLVLLLTGSTDATFVENVVCDSIGAVGIGILLTAVLAGYEWALRVGDWKSGLARGLFGGALLAAVGLAIVAATYGVLLLLYDQTPARLEIGLRPPLTGVYYHDPKYLARQSEEEKDYERGDLSLLPSRSGFLTTLSSPGGHTFLRWSSDERQTIHISIVRDCADPQEGLKLKPARPILSVESSDLGIGFDKGWSDLAFTRLRHATAAISQDAPTQFWISGKPDAREYDYFLGTGDRIALSNEEGGMSFVFGAALYAKHGDQLRLGRRSLTIRIGARTYRIAMDGSGMLNAGSRVNCTLVPLGPPAGPRITSGSTYDARFTPGTMFGGVRVDITPLVMERQNRLPANGNRIEIVRTNGWLKLSDVDASGLAGNTLGSTHLLALEKGVSFLELDGEPVNLRRERMITAMGTFAGSYDARGDVIFRGEAFSAWGDRQRLTKTRWERLPAKIQLAILAGLLPCLWGVLKLANPAWKRFNQSDPLLWP